MAGENPMLTSDGNSKARHLSKRDLQEYRVYRIRLEQFLHLFLLYLDIKASGEIPRNELGHGPKEFASTLQVAVLGWLASLVDQHPSAINVFKLWVRVFPDRVPEIEAVRTAIQPHLDTLKLFRDEVAFHGNKSFERQCRVYEAVTTPELSQATYRFLELCISIMREENSVTELRQMNDASRADGK